MLLDLNWHPNAVAEAEHVNSRSVYRIQRSKRIYDTPYPPPFSKLGKPRKISVGAGSQLLQYLDERPWAYHDEMAQFLEDEFDLECSNSTISRFLLRARVSNKIGQRLSDKQDPLLRQAWQADMLDLRAEQLVFVDESSFNERTGWRRKAWAPIGSPARYHGDLTRNKSWSIIPAYTVGGYLPCIGIRHGSYDTDALLDWIQELLLPCLSPGMVVIMDNNTTHCDARVKQVIEAAGYQIRFLPPYSPDYNPIELTFSVLKAWVKRHYRRLWPTFEGDFGAFLAWAIEHSECDRFGQEHFQYSAGGYIFEGDYEGFQRELDQMIVAREAETITI